MKFQVIKGPLDRLVRLVLGVSLLVVALAGWVSAPLLHVFLLGATIGLVTAVTGFCPTYVLVGISTRASADR